MESGTGTHDPPLNEPPYSDGQPPVNDAIVGGRKGVASFINLTFQGRIGTRSGFVNQMTVSRWLCGQLLPNGCREFFPPPDGAGRFSKAAVRLWVESYLLKEPDAADLAVLGDDTDWDTECKRERALLARRMREQYEKAASNLYGLRSDHISEMQQVLAAVWSRFWNCVEVDVPDQVARMVNDVKAFICASLPPEFPAEKKREIEGLLDGLVTAVHKAGCDGVDALQREFAAYAAGKGDGDAENGAAISGSASAVPVSPLAASPSPGSGAAKPGPKSFNPEAIA